MRFYRNCTSFPLVVDMFKKRKNSRTYRHNKNIASLLSFVAGIVNVTGILSLEQLTTNVTGHFGYFVDEMFKMHYFEGFIYFLYILFFFLGSFASNLLIELISKRSDRFIYIIPTIIEMVILFLLAVLGSVILEWRPHVIALSLLFAMGFQNSLVTVISNAVVRTTHLTGLFTDLGIEVSKLFFYKIPEQRRLLKRTIYLRLRIILFFFSGGICGGIVYSRIGFYVLFIPVALLFLGIFYDTMKYQLILLKRKKYQQLFRMYKNE